MLHHEALLQLTHDVSKSGGAKLRPSAWRCRRAVVSSGAGSG